VPTLASGPAEAGSSILKRKVRQDDPADGDGAPSEPGARKRRRIGRNGESAVYAAVQHPQPQAAALLDPHLAAPVVSEQATVANGPRPAPAAAPATPVAGAHVEKLSQHLAKAKLPEGRQRWLLGCGDNVDHSLGIKAYGAQSGAGPLVRVNVGVLDPGSVMQICSGAMFSAFLTKTGKVYTCGAQDTGALGRHIPNDDEGAKEAAQMTPTPVENAPPNIKEIAAGEGFLACLTQDGSVYLCGGFRDAAGARFTPGGDETFFGTSHRIRRVPLPGTVERVFAGQSANFFFALGSDGTLYSCGTLAGLFSSMLRLRSTFEL
jgi:hypothetical protein